MVCYVFDDVVGVLVLMMCVCEFVCCYVKFDVIVFVFGESGIGKEMIV